jgi:penicillin-binding protein 1A
VIKLAPLKQLLSDQVLRVQQMTRRQKRLALAATPALFVLYLLVLIPLTPSISDIRKAKLEQPTQVMSSDGKPLAEFRRASGARVPLREISPHVVNALIATEDHRFYDHHGMDWRRTAGAALNTFTGNRQGGSTITQQLARNLYPEEIGRAPTLNRKLKEAITALKIEALYTKQEILETYLNTVPFLYNAYGIEMAARTYFDKSADQLDVLESATLVGMLKGNSYYNPVLNPERSLQRRNIVLAQMVKHDKLDAAKYEVLKKRPLRVEFERQIEPTGPAPHFAQQLRKWLINWADSHDYNIYTDGLVVRTTIDSRLQTMANQAVARQGRQLQGIADAAWAPRSVWGAGSELVQSFVRDTPEFKAALATGLTDDAALKKLTADTAFMRALREQKTRVQAGFMALDPKTGQIRAWVGSRDFQVDPFDHVQQARRQPGSTFKPFVYGAAFDKGASPDDTLVDQAVAIPISGDDVWRPSDDGPPSGRTMTLRDGLAYSKNTITAQLMQAVGPARVAKLATAMGVRQSKLDPVLSLALGTSPVTLKEMVTAYGTIANSGGYLEPMMVTQIENRKGEVVAAFSPAAVETVLSPAADYTLLDAMRGVVDKGTGVAIRSRYGIRGDVAGKTGTTQDNTDGWFILMHPQLVTGAWVGFNDGRVTLRSDYWGQGAHSALPMVGDFTAQALRARIIDTRVKFAEPQDASIIAPLLGRLRAWAIALMGKASVAPSQPGAAPVPTPDSAQESAPAPELPAVQPGQPLEPAEASGSTSNGMPVVPAPAAPAAVPVAPPAAPAPEPVAPPQAEVRSNETIERAP